MKTSESLKEILPALLKAQKAMGSAKKDSVNPFFKTKYADLPAVMEVCKEPLNDNGILVLQVIEDGFVKTTLIHATSGEWIASETPIVCARANDPQSYGSSVTYAKRYDLQSLMFIPADDDDGNKGSGKVVEAPTRPVEKPTVNVSTPSPIVTHAPTDEFTKVRREYFAVAKEMGMDSNTANVYLKTKFNVEHFNDIPEMRLRAFISAMRKKQADDEAKRQSEALDSISNLDLDELRK